MMSIRRQACWPLDAGTLKYPSYILNYLENLSRLIDEAIVELD